MSERLSYSATDDEKGLTVNELYHILGDLIAKGRGEAVCKGSRGDDVMRYVESYSDKSVLIMEAF